MRGELDDALARLRRWDEVRQRLAGESAEAPPKPAAPVAPPVPEAAPPPPPVPVSAPPQTSVRAPEPHPGPPRVVEEVVEAIAGIMHRHPRAAVTVTVEEAGLPWTAYLARKEDGQLAITRLDPRSSGGSVGEAPPQWPVTGRAPEAPERTASRLAELIRRDPTLLEPPDDRRR